MSVNPSANAPMMFTANVPHGNGELRIWRWIDKPIRLLPLPTDATSRKRKNTEERRAQIKALADVDDLANHRGTAWAAVNAVADFVAHGEPSRKQERWEEARFERAVINGDALLDRAHDLALELVG